MLTSYLVRCPHSPCNWFGSLLPCNDTRAYQSFAPPQPTVEFECPQCHRHWRARRIGDDVVTLPLEEEVAQPV